MTKETKSNADAGNDAVETLAKAAAANDKFAFIELTGTFSPYISTLAGSFGLPESEYDDLCQVGRIALYRAVCSYKSERSCFTPYAKVCIKNAMTSLMRSYRSGNKLSKDGVSLDDPETASVSPMADGSEMPENVLLAEEFLHEVEKIIHEELSESERQVLQYKLSGIGIPEISVLTGKKTKSVENTLFRARKKLKARLNALK